MILNPKLKFTQKINYMASVWYWYASWKRLIYIMSPILFATFDVVVVKCTLLEVLIFWLPMYISSNISLKMMSRNIRTTRWTNLYETIIFPFLLIPTLLETFGISMKKFKVTKKGGDAQEQKNWPYAIPHFILIVLSIIGIARCIDWTFTTGQIDYLVILFWLLLNFYNLVMSLFFILGRKAVRSAERQRAAIPCRMITRFEEEDGVTEDIAEGGLSILLKEPHDIAEQETVTLVLKNEHYQATVEVRVVSVSRKEKEYRYAFVVTDYKDDKADYFQMIYDRVPSLPENLDESQSSFEDLRTNVKRRIYTTEYHNRKKARIPVNKIFETDKKQKVVLVDYNYDYALLKRENWMPDKMELKIKEGLGLSLEFCKETQEGLLLYRVLNEAELYENKKLHEAVDSWIREQFGQSSPAQLEQTVSNKRKRMQAEDEFSELEHL